MKSTLWRLVESQGLQVNLIGKPMPPGEWNEPPNYQNTNKIQEANKAKNTNTNTQCDREALKKKLNKKINEKREERFTR
jgi:hypothetical protein